MLIIFDLDDTLIDTSGSITPFKLKECLKIFANHGLELFNFEEAYQELLSINLGSAGSKDALFLFLKKRKADPALLSFGLKEMMSPLPDHFLIPTTPHAKEILKLFAQTHTIALVTGGYPPFQLEKLEKAGIEPGIFSKIEISEDSVKKPFYERLMREFNLPAHQVIVCGDRIGIDLTPAYELGFTTVHMRWGRGEQLKTEPWIHHTISDLKELTRIVKT